MALNAYTNTIMATLPSTTTSLKPPILLFDIMYTIVLDPFYHDIPAFFRVSFNELIESKHPTAWIEFEKGLIDEFAWHSCWKLMFTEMLRNPMDSEAEALEEKLTSLLGQLRAERDILERVVYKNKNQHRRSSYFQYLMKVRRDLRLLESTKLEEILECCFQSITGKRPKQKVHLLESLKRRKCESGKYNFMERLMGAARLLAQMVEPMLKAAIQISTLLARSFFMGFSLTILALLARLRVLVQQILLDVVSVFNVVSSVSQKKQSVKINQAGVEVFREYYPTQEDFITLECVWNSDKFELLERKQKRRIASPGVELSFGTSSVLYQSIESSLGDDDITSVKAKQDNIAEHNQVQVIENKIDPLSGPSNDDDVKLVEPSGEGSSIKEPPSKARLQEDSLLQSSSSIPCLGASKLKSGPVKVAFIQIKKPITSTANVNGDHSKQTDTN